MSYNKKGQQRLKRRKRSSAKKSFDLNKAILVAVKTGKTLLGFKSVERELMTGTLKLILLARNAPDQVVNQINLLNQCLEDPVPVYTADMSSHDLGATCAKPFWVSAMGILKEGDSSILSVMDYVPEDE